MVAVKASLHPSGSGIDLHMHGISTELFCSDLYFCFCCFFQYQCLSAGSMLLPLPKLLTLVVLQQLKYLLVIDKCTFFFAK